MQKILVSVLYEQENKVKEDTIYLVLGESDNIMESIEMSYADPRINILKDRVTWEVTKKISVSDNYVRERIKEII